MKEGPRQRKTKERKPTEKRKPEVWRTQYGTLEATDGPGDVPDIAGEYQIIGVSDEYWNKR